MKKTLLLLALFLTAIMVHGQNWTYITNTGTTYILYGMSFPPDQSTVGFACGMQYTSGANGVIIKTIDGGNNWIQVWPVSGTISGLHAIWFTSEQVGFACGYNNLFLKTTDGGVSWNPITVGSDVWYYRDMEFRDANNGIAVASMNNAGAQAAFITSNGGTTWVPSTSGLATNEVMGISYATQNIVYAVGTGGNVFKSTDGGHNWIINNTLPALLFGVHFVNASFGVVGAEETIFATNNGGASWTTFTTGYENFYATRAYADGTAFVGGTDENIYTTTDFGQSWSMDFNGTGTSTLYRIRQTPNGTRWACGSQGKIMKKEQLLEADFTANPTNVCAGNSVSFIDNSSGTVETWSWTFEGGNPTASNLQNPVVSYTSPGIYDVSLTITSGSNSNTETKTDYITVFQGTGQPVTPSGATETCGTYSYDYTTESVLYAESYEWQVSPVSAGSVTGNGTVGTFLASNSWSGTYTVKVRAISQCGAGPWSTELSGSLFHNPVIYDLVGTGAFCEGEPGAEIVLNGSETGITYELFKDNVTTGITIAGTGAQISFGFFDETGLYTATGYNVQCSEIMVGQIYVHMEPMPGQAAAPQGDQTVCNDMSNEYFTAGAANADGYAWTLDPSDAGVVTTADNECTVAWSNDFSGTAWLTVTGVNDCGSGVPSEALQVSVNPAPDPSVSGPAMVCDNDPEDYSTSGNSGSSYEWAVTGGSIISGAGTQTVSILWGNPGTGSVSVTETTADGCTAAAEALSVIIDDCTGLNEGQEYPIMVYPNPATDRVNIHGLNQATVRIYNILGKEMKVFNQLNGSQAIDITSFQKGIYLLKIEQGGAAKTIQLIKQ